MGNLFVFCLAGSIRGRAAGKKGVSFVGPGMADGGHWCPVAVVIVNL
jgi:hypothetical protein